MTVHAYTFGYLLYVDEMLKPNRVGSDFFPLVWNNFDIFSDTYRTIDDIAVVKANKSYLVKELETAFILKEFQEYPDFMKIDTSAEKKKKNTDIVDTILRNPTHCLQHFNCVIRNNDKFRNICKRLDDSRYTHGKKIGIWQ